MLIQVTTIGGPMLVNTNLIEAVTQPFDKEEGGSLLWVSIKTLPDAGYGEYGDQLLWVEETIGEILEKLR